MAAPDLNKRYRWYELSDVEAQNTFLKENVGYVRYTDKRVGMFRLDPSPFKKTEKNEVFIVEKPPLPPAGKLIEVVVRETQKYRELVGGGVEETKIKFVSRWELVDPNKLRRIRDFSKDDFMDFLIAPLHKNYYLDSLRESLGMIAVASPQVNEIQKGGINTVVLGKFGKREKWSKFKHITRIVPKEFRRTTSKHFYKNLETLEIPDPANSTEISLSYYNITESPFDIPLPFNVEFRDKAAYIENYLSLFGFARGFLLDALLFQPEIPDESVKKFENKINFVNEEFARFQDVRYYRRSGIAAVRLANSYSRLNFNSITTTDDLDRSTELWAELTEGIMTTGFTAKQHRGVYNLALDEETVLTELTVMEETGIALTLSNLKQRKMKLQKPLEEILKRLSEKNYIYFPNKDTLRFIKD